MKKVIKSIFQYVGAVLLAIVIAALLRFFIVDFYSIPSDSMYPTIEPGDFIVVNKMYMGARFYKNFDFLDGAHPETVRVPGFSSLKRNDVIVFNFPTHRPSGRHAIDHQGNQSRQRQNGIRKRGRTATPTSLSRGVHPGYLQRFPFRLLAPLEHPRLWSPIPSRRGNHHPTRHTKFLALSSPDCLRNPSSSTLATTPTLHPRLLDPGIHVPKKLVLRGRRSSLQLQRFSLYRSYSRRLYRG